MARSQILQENEALRREWAEEQAGIVAKARTAAEQQVAAAKVAIARELEAAKADLSGTLDQLSSQIETSVMTRRAA